MTDKQTAAYLREWAKAPAHGLFAWPTDACGYDQYTRFVTHRNQHWKGYSKGTFNQFVLDYADLLDPPVVQTHGMQCDDLRREYYVKDACCVGCHESAALGQNGDLWYRIHDKMRYVCCTVAASTGAPRLPDEVRDGRHLLFNG